jgi:hypothetical protein
MRREAMQASGNKGERAARQLAREFGLPEDSVIANYKAELERMRDRAAVSQFIELLAVKHVKLDLLSRPRSTPIVGQVDARDAGPLGGAAA